MQSDSLGHWAALAGIVIAVLGVIGIAYKGWRFSLRAERWFENVNSKLGQPNGGGSIAGEVIAVQAHLQRQDEQLNRGEARFEKLEAGQRSTHEQLSQLKHAQEDFTAELQRLNELHETERES